MDVKFYKNYRNNWATEDDEFELIKGGLGGWGQNVVIEHFKRSWSHVKTINEAKKEIREFYQNK